MRTRAHGRGILRHALLLSREAASELGVMGAGRRGCVLIHSWDKPEVVPPGVTCVVRESLLGGASHRFFRRGRGARGYCTHSPIFGCSFRRHGGDGPRILFARGVRGFYGWLSICGRPRFSRRRPSVRAGCRSLQPASKIGAGGPVGSYSDRPPSVMNLTMPRGDDCAWLEMPEEAAAPWCRRLGK